MSFGWRWALESSGLEWVAAANLPREDLGNLESVAPSVKFQLRAPAVQEGPPCQAQVCFASLQALSNHSWPTQLLRCFQMCVFPFPLCAAGTGMGVKRPCRNKECAGLEAFSSKDPRLRQPAQLGIFQLNWKSSNP